MIEGNNGAGSLIMDLQGRGDEVPKVLYTERRTLDSVESIREWVPQAMLDIDERLAQ